MADPAFALLGPPAEWTLSRVMRRQAVRHGEREFATFGDGSKLSFKELDQQSDEVASALLNTGLQRGERVFAMLRNRREFLLLALACGRAGAVFVPVNTELKGYSLQHQLHNCAPRLVFVEADLLPVFNTVEPGPSLPSLVVILGAEEGAEKVPSALGGTSACNWQTFETRALGDCPGLMEPQPHEVGCIMYTSGTTGPAKGVLMPHAHLALFSVPSPALQLTKDDCYYVCMPLFHANALFVQVLASLVAGARVHCVQRFSPSRWLAEVRASGATITNSLGVMTEMLFKTPASPDDSENPLRRMLAVPVADWIGDFARRFDLQVFQGYGMTECNMVAYAENHDPCVPGCCGSLRPELFEVAILEPDTDVPVPRGEVGEVCVRPKIPNAFMQGYFGMPDKTAESWRNLWFHTGDAGFLDSRERLYFVDRIKDRIRRRGENVSAFEVEQALGVLDGVAECAVVGIVVGDAGSEQEIKACVVREPGKALAPLDVLRHCIMHVPRFAVPRFIEFVEALPRTPSNKVQKHLLRATGCSAAWDRESEGHSARVDWHAKRAEGGDA